MQGEDVYTALDFSLGKGTTADPSREDTAATDTVGPHGPRWHRRVIWLSGVLNILLALAVIGFGVWVFRLHQNRKSRWGSEDSSIPGSEPASCPPGWQVFHKKCYYFSEGRNTKNWSLSHEYCSTNGSRLSVIQDNEEQNFLSKSTKTHAWIGLFNAPGRRWTWVNGSIISQKVYVSGSGDGGMCGTVTEEGIVSDDCGNYLNWICEMDAKKT